MASHKVDKVEKMITDREIKDYSQLYKHITSLSAIMSTFKFLIISCFCCCCCCSGYRILWFKIWDKWSPKNCLKETSDRLCINIMNVKGKQPLVRYHTTRISPTTSTHSLPNILTITPDEKDEKDEKEESESQPTLLRQSLREKQRLFR